MKPLCLTMSAFGPYAREQVLDFRELGGRSFFLIHGPTGAGKTTILDAMCFALYGDTSGTSRDSRTVRSDHADSGQATQVVFDFSVGETGYRILRSPEQVRPKKRGDGTTVKAAEAELSRLKDSGEAELITAGWSDVTRKVEELLGFKSSQFRQVVLLPQGEFRRLLTANSTERQEIMQTLFKTERYKYIEERLKTKAQTLKKQFEELQKEREWILAEAAIASKEALCSRLADNEQTMKAIAAELAQAALQLEQAQAAVTEGKRIQDKLTEREEAQTALRQFSEKIPVVEEKRQELLQARQAAGLADVENSVRQYEAEVARLEAHRENHALHVEQARAALAAAEQRATAEQARESEREQAAAEVLRLNELGGKLAAFTEAAGTLRTAQQAAGQALRAREAAAAQLAAGKQDVQRKTTEYHVLLEQSAVLGTCKAEQEELERVLGKRKLAQSLRADWQKSRQRLAEAQEKQQNGEKLLAAAREHLNKLQEEWAKGQAALMAQRLTAGTPCPVCGSCQHPRPARSASRVPQEEDVKRQQQAVQKCEQDLERFRRELGELQTAANTLHERLADCEEELGDKLSIDLGVLTAQLEAVKVRFQQAAAAERQVSTANRQLAELTELEKTANERLEQTETHWRQADSRLKAVEAVVNERRQGIPPELEQPGVLKEAQAAALKRQQQLKQSLESAQLALQSRTQEWIKSQTEQQNILANCKNGRERWQAQQLQFEQRLQEAGFAGREQYEVSKKSAAYMDKLDERIQVFDRELIAKREWAARTKEAAADLIAPAMAALEQAAAGAQTQHNGLLARHTAIQGQVSREREWLARLNTLSGNTDAVAERYKVIGQLAEVANGSNEHRLTFQRFVLGALLDDVAIAANERLKTMSRGRYYLQRTNDRARKNAAGGLELEVFDQYTGTARAVGTLSGGETFLASLSLALGLADVVQTYAGGIHLDTILVDEGFGTLDPESLDFAIKALIDLQKGGRLVGIISHVPELKERIDARLEVIPTQHGSTARFRVG